MRISSEEIERPTEWLRRLSENRGLYRQLLEHAGSVALAAYRLARARCRIQPVPSAVPTVAELKVAVHEIARFAGLASRLHIGQIVADCEHAGLPVIVPISASAA
jgi:hypothetical protein